MIIEEKYLRHKNGFTLIELLMVIAILAIIAALGRDFYVNYQKGVEIETTARTLISDLRRARDRAMNGEADRNWGVRLANQSSDYYEIFSTPSDYADASKIVADTIYLPKNIYFSAPAEGNNLDVIFTKISGTTTPVAIGIISSSTSKTVNISGSGNVY